MHPIRLALPGLWWCVPPKVLNAIIVLLRCLQLSRVFSLLLFKIKYLFSYSPGQVGKSVKDLCFWVGNFMRQMFRICSLSAQFNKLPKSNSLLQEGHFISVHTLPFEISALLQYYHKKPETKHQANLNLHPIRVQHHSIVLLFQRDKSFIKI